MIIVYNSENNKHIFIDTNTLWIDRLGHVHFIRPDGCEVQSEKSVNEYTHSSYIDMLNQNKVIVLDEYTYGKFSVVNKTHIF